MKHEEKIFCQLKSDGQKAKLYQHIMSDLKTVQEAKELLGYDCFTEEAGEMSGTLRMLKRMHVFSETEEDFNEQLQEAFDRDDKTARRIRFYIEQCMKRKEE